ncbi:NACHT and WD repeat domain-containing protein 2-like [Penaeus monodon]|uniref:NACHT and WD repeat domain-containing protein 2-like n=1 Tax=Penaeus monodon TaxID=6687 RepID=UPI0018A6F9AF|nr:NACHT and WD repeat domain-containing protein 2-like [Penaeus monodon]
MDDRTVDKIFAGQLDTLPPVSSKVCRIFTSSTFTDMLMERNTLMAEVYPRLKEFCREKHGLEFQVVDMRWGVRDEATDDHMTTELCMREIDNCQRLSMGPNFVVFGGQKYGYRPIPTVILGSELLMLREALINMGVDTILIDTWYKRDSNAVPFVYILQPISSILVNFNNKRVPKLQAQDQATWWDTLSKMQKLLRKAAQACYNTHKMDKEAMHNYFMSVTEREVINGILAVKNTKNHTLALVRYINNINLQNLRRAANFIDIVNRQIDGEAMKLLSDLRDVRLPARIEASNYHRYTVEWIGREGLAKETHGEYLQEFCTHFYKGMTKLIDRAMRKEDSSAQGQIITEILQHLHACKNSVQVFYGREEEVKKVEDYIKGPSVNPLLLHGAGGCGKTSLLAKCAASSFEWLAHAKPILVIRFVGTSPESTALTPLLTSICHQISYNYMLPFEDIPDDLVPLTAHLKELLNCATTQMPLLIYLDSVDQVTGATDANRMSWIPTRLPPNVKIVVSCVSEDNDPELSKDYTLLRRMIDNIDNFLEVRALGEDLAMDIIKKWMCTAKRDLNNYQWRVVSNAISRCSLPIFVKLVFAEICRWKSYSKPQDTYLASNVMDSIMMLFSKVEVKHGRLLVFHALAYITASKNGLSESELEDLISLDDKVLDDVYQYHMPPVRRIPPLLWTRIRNDLPNYLSDCEADGVSVLNWYHRQFKEAAIKRYFTNQNMAQYFYSMIADYFLGTWGGGIPKPFKYTEIQRHRFNLKSKEGLADRKVPAQPLVYYNKDGKVSRYNLRKFGELPYHLIRARRFEDLYKHVLFNYQWLHAKLSSCPLQAVLSDFEDAISHIDDRDQIRELMLVADALRLGGAILSQYPDMLAPQLIGRLLPEMETNPNVKSLLLQCDAEGIDHCGLLPTYHCSHTPGGPLKYSLEGHQFAVFGFRLTNDLRYIVSVSNKFITWDLSTSDLTREVIPGIEGIMQDLVLSPDNKYSIAHTNNSQTVLLNMLTSEFFLLENPMPGETVIGSLLSDSCAVIHGERSWVLYTLRGEIKERVSSPVDKPILFMDFKGPQDYSIICWSGDFDDKNLLIHTVVDGNAFENLDFHRYSEGEVTKERGGGKCVMTWTTCRTYLYCCVQEHGQDVCAFTKGESSWMLDRIIAPNDEKLLMLHLTHDQKHLIGTFMLGFKVWEVESGKGWTLRLPHGIRNISTQLLKSNSCVLSKGYKYAVAGVRKNLYVWELETQELLKVLDAHFGRIMDMVALTVGNWNSVITSSLDRTVKVWNINNIFEQVHVIDRHELSLLHSSLAVTLPLAVTVTRNCVGIWNLKLGKLVSKLADSPLGAIVTHAKITHNSRYIVSTESGNVLFWMVRAEAVVFKAEQKNVQQLMLLDDDTKCVTVSKISEGTGEPSCFLVTRSIPDGAKVYEFDYPIRVFKSIAVTADGLFLVIPSIDGMKDALLIYHAKTGTLVHKMPLKYPSFKDFHMVVPLPNKPTQVALIDQDKGNIVDIRTKKFVRSIAKWGGKVSKDGRYGLYAPARGGLELLELRHGTSVRTLIPRVAEGVFSVICLFTRTDEYVLYYHGGRKTIRVFRLTDGKMIANYRVQAELTAIAASEDGRTIVLGTVDGCLSSLTIADPTRNGIKEYLADLPSRNPQSVDRDHRDVNLTDDFIASSRRLEGCEGYKQSDILRKYKEEEAKQNMTFKRAVNMVMLTNRLQGDSSSFFGMKKAES